MTSDDEDDEHRIEEIYHQLEALSLELAHIKERARTRATGENPRRRFTIIPGGIAAVISILAGLGALLRRRPRHPVALAGATAALACAALVLILPTHRSTPPPNTIALPPTVALSDSLTALQATPTPSPDSPSTPGAPPTTPGLPASMYIPAATPTPQTSGTAPAAPSPTPSATVAPYLGAPPPACVVEAIVPGLIYLCLV